MFWMLVYSYLIYTIKSKQKNQKESENESGSKGNEKVSDAKSTEREKKNKDVHLVNLEDREDYQMLKLEEYSMKKKIEKNSKWMVQR